MKVNAVQGFVYDGKIYDSGDVLDVSGEFARHLQAARLGVIVPEAEAGLAEAGLAEAGAAEAGAAEAGAAEAGAAEAGLAEAGLSNVRERNRKK